MKLSYVCECGGNHARKIINARDYEKLAEYPEYLNDADVFIVRENCEYREKGEIVLARSGKLVLVKAPDLND